MAIRLSCTILFCLVIALRSAACQTAGASPETKSASTGGLSFWVTLIADRGRDRYGNIGLERGNWLVQNINWTNPNGQYALSALVGGRRFRISRWVDASVLAGPWYSYDQHSWNEAVLATHFRFHAGRFEVASENYWGFPLRRSGYFYNAHAQSMKGWPHLPRWLGASLLEERTSHGLERLFVGPLLTRQMGPIKVSAFPYWDVQRGKFDLRAVLSYRHESGKFDGE